MILDQIMNCGSPRSGFRTLLYDPGEWWSGGGTGGWTEGQVHVEVERLGTEAESAGQSTKVEQKTRLTPTEQGTRVEPTEQEPTRAEQTGQEPTRAEQTGQEPTRAE